eukprot:2411178-Karenia_brevis.AAC.1
MDAYYAILAVDFMTNVAGTQLLQLTTTSTANCHSFGRPWQIYLALQILGTASDSKFTFKDCSLATLFRS